MASEHIMLTHGILLLLAALLEMPLMSQGEALLSLWRP